MKELPQSPSADKFDDLPLDERELVVETARHMHALVYQYAVPLTIGRTSYKSLRLPVNSATAILLRRGPKLFAVTANHVVQKVFERRNSGEPVGLFLSDVFISVPPLCL